MGTDDIARARPGLLLAAITGLLNAVSAAAGGVFLALGVLSLGPGLTARLPWGSAALGGTALVLWVAVPNAVLTVLALRADRRTGAASVAVGTLLVAWIAVELAFIRELSFFHPLYVVIGSAQVALGAHLVSVVHHVGPATLLAEVRDVLVDLPVFLTSPLYRRWHLRWGATDEEVAAPMPGDDLSAGATYRSTRAIDVAAPPSLVWPWLVQVGCGRAGFYSNDLLDNLGRPSAREIVPALQHLEPGSLVPMSPEPSEATSFRVVAYDEPRWLLWAKLDSTWAWSLQATPDGGTRLVTRIRASFEGRHPVAALVWRTLMEVGDFAMLRRMLRGIRARAESHAHVDVDPTQLPGRGRGRERRQPR